MKHAWIETFSGRKFEILNPKQESVTIEDIAHALSQVCRFGGHTKYFYSVAQHSYLGSYLVPEKDSLWFLLHDASEAYIGDMTTPMKHLTKAGEAYLPIEKRIMQVVCQKFNLAETQPPSVHAADVAMLHAEKEQLMGSVPWDRKWGKLIKPADVKIKELTPRKIEKLFLKRFRELQTAQTKGESNGRN